jgi:hypothetical protein
MASIYFGMLLTTQQEDYRGHGPAKAIALKLFRNNAVNFAPDGLYHADVAFNNLQSQGVCRSLKGTVEWSVYCTFVLNSCCITTES